MSSNCLDAKNIAEKHTEVCGQESLGLALPPALRRNIVCFFCRGKRILYQWKLTYQVNQENYLFKFLYNLLLQEALNIFVIQLHLKILQISLDANLCCIIFSTCLLYVFHLWLHIMLQYLFSPCTRTACFNIRQLSSITSVISELEIMSKDMIIA